MVRRLLQSTILLIVVAVAARWTFCWIVFPHLLAPMSTVGRTYYFDSYREIAAQLLSGNGFRLEDGTPVLHRPPGYVAFMMLANPRDPSVSYLWFQFLHGLLGGLAAWLTVRAARGWGVARPGAMLAGWIVALWPFTIWVTKVSVPENLLVALIPATVYAAARARESFGWAAATGLLGASAALTHALYQALLAGLVIAIAASSAPMRRRLLAAVLIAITFAAPLVAWSARNVRVAGENVGLATGFGFHYWIGIYYFEALRSGRPYFHDLGVPAIDWVTTAILAPHGLPPIDTNPARSDPRLNRRVDHLAKEHMLDHPIYTAVKIMVKMPLAWVHQQTPLRSAATAVLLAPLFFFAAFAPRRLLPIAATIIIMNAAAALVMVESIPMRYVLGLIPMLAILTGAGVIAFTQRQPRRSATAPP